MMFREAPFRIVQTPTLTVILLEMFTRFRQVPTDGRRLVADPQPTWFGYSTGKWEADEFVVETVGFNDQTWLDNRGLPHSDALHLTERFKRLNVGRMDLASTIDDPKAYTRPWSVTVKFELLADTDLLEYMCDNEKWASLARNRDRRSRWTITTSPVEPCSGFWEQPELLVRCQRLCPPGHRRNRCLCAVAGRLLAGNIGKRWPSPKPRPRVEGTPTFARLPEHRELARTRGCVASDLSPFRLRGVERSVHGRRPPHSHRAADIRTSKRIGAHGLEFGRRYTAAWA